MESCCRHSASSEHLVVSGVLPELHLVLVHILHCRDRLEYGTFYFVYPKWAGLLCGFSYIVHFAVSLYVLDRSKYQPKPSITTNTRNPYKGKRRVKDESKIPQNVHEKYTQLILDLVLYDAEECRALRDFEPVKMNTHCIFARKAILWGARDYNKALPLGTGH